VSKLSTRKVAALSAPGRYGDGDGLWLQVSITGTKAWLLRYMRNGRARHMGLGPLSLVSLAEARERAKNARRLLLDGADPLEARAAERQRAALATAVGITFRECAERYIAAHESGWRSAIHRRQWSSSLDAYALPIFGDLPVSAIDTALVTKALEAIWFSKPETGARVRGRIESVLDWATARGYRQGENPARWKGHLKNLLPAPRKIRRVKHLAALEHAELPAFMSELRDREAVAARALEFLILTASRTGEVLGARWDEIDGDVWVIPANRMKGQRDHRVPLSPRALGIIRHLPGDGEFVFPGNRRGAPLSGMAMLRVLHRMGREDLTAHGFRSTFRDWVSEQTSYPREVAEASLAHAVESKVERAYRRGDLFDKRRRLMAEWAAFCASPTAERGAVVALRP
jgi:integrase